MTNAWDVAEDQMNKHDNGGLFVRLQNDGDKVVGVFVGDPLPREVVWTGEKYAEMNTPEAERAAQDGKRPTLKVGINFYDLGDKSLKVYEMNVGTFKTLVKLRKKYGLDAWAFEVERQGAKGDPKTKYSILPEHQLDDRQIDTIAHLELHDLSRRLGGKAANDNCAQSTTRTDCHDDIPF